jgi:transposase-like protein
MPVSTKRGKVVTRSIRTKKLCPGCGHEEFKVVESKFSWLLGQRFVCANCGLKFKKANLVRVHEKSREWEAQKTSGSHRPKGRRRR